MKTRAVIKYIVQENVMLNHGQGKILDGNHLQVDRVVYAVKYLCRMRSIQMPKHALSHVIEKTIIKFIEKKELSRFVDGKG